MRRSLSSSAMNPRSQSCTMEGSDDRAPNSLPSTHPPTFRVSLLSIGQFDTAGYTSTFGKRVCEISSGDHTISGRKCGNLYMVEAERNATAYTSELHAETKSQAEPPSTSPDRAHSEGKRRRKKRKRSIVTATSRPGPKPGPKTASESKLWHRRLAHLYPAAMRSLIDGFTHEDTQCDVCVQAKHRQKFTRTMVKRTTTPYELVHSDVCGPFASPTHKGYKYFILYIDDYSRYSDVYLLPNTLVTTLHVSVQSISGEGRRRSWRVPG